MFSISSQYYSTFHLTQAFDKISFIPCVEIYIINLTSIVLDRPKLKALMKIIERLLYGKKPQKQTTVNFTPVNDKDTDFSVETDVNSDVNNDVGIPSNTVPSGNHWNSKNIDETFSTDTFTPTTPQMRFETLLDSIKGGQMNVYALPVFYNENGSKIGPSKTVITPAKSMGIVKTTQRTPSRNILGVFIKETNSPKTDHVTSVNHMPHTTSDTSPLVGVSHDKTDGSAPAMHVLSNSHRLTVHKVLKVLLHKWLHEMVNKNKHTRKWREDDEKLPGYYNNTHDPPTSLSNADLDRFADYARLRLTHRQDSVTSQGISTVTDRPQLHLYEHPNQVAQRITPFFDLSSTASTQQKSVCWNGEIMYNYTLVGGINAGTFSDNGKTSNMDICMQFCCKRDSCDLAFMIEDDCYSVSCNSNGACEPRKARPTHYFPRIAIRKRPQGENCFI